MDIVTAAPQPWTHTGREWTNGEPLLAMDASLTDVWRSDRFDELIDLGAGATLIAVGDGTAGIISAGHALTSELTISGWRGRSPME